MLSQESQDGWMVLNFVQAALIFLILFHFCLFVYFFMVFDISAMILLVKAFVIEPEPLEERLFYQNGLNL